jgi:hypothetical protein
MPVSKFGSGSRSNFSYQQLPSLQNVVRTNTDGDIDMTGKQIKNMGEPSDDGDAVTLSYVEGIFTSDLDLHHKRIKNLGLPTHKDDAVTKEYSDLNLLRSGGTMDGDLDMNKCKIVNLPEPTDDNACATKKYTDFRIRLDRGNTMVSTSAGKHVNVNTDWNIGIGNEAMYELKRGENNIAIGVGSLRHNANCSGNIAIGNHALRNMNNGDNNIVIGVAAGNDIMSNANDNILIGNRGVQDESNTIRIGQDQTKCYIAGLTNLPGLNSLPVRINRDGRLGTGHSCSRRYKKEIRDARDYDISNLRVVKFKYNEGDDEHIGLIAEEAASVLPEIVIYDNENRPDAICDTNLMFIMLQQIQKLQNEVATLARLSSV